MSGTSGRSARQSAVRIIGGIWRGRKLAFTPSEGLRPTGDRIRETLFNWLAPELRGARCVDLFTGSGALGLEALSRGAVHCDFVDSASRVISTVQQHLKTLDAQDRGLCHQCTAQQFLENAPTPYDIVFIDPPFKLQLVEPVLNTLVQRSLLLNDALVYIETAASESLPAMPSNWSKHREKSSGGVSYRLFRIAQGVDQR
ncbi:MAG: 16S rRNA (guanine(966)-N(2))-methyltransferase RsmD [Halioglobus sp.]